MWHTILEENGIAVVPIDPEHVRLDAGSGAVDFFVLALPRTVRPHDIYPAPEPYALLVGSAITAAALDRAEANNWSVVAEDGTTRVRLAGHHLRLDPGAPAISSPRRPRGRPGRGAASVIRTLFALEGGATQEEIAQYAHVSQGAVSKALGRLAEQGLVTRGSSGWTVADRDGAISWWLANYPGPGGITTWWFGTDPVTEQAYRAYQLLLRAQEADPIVSGDVVADLVAPWRAPQLAMLYAKRGANLAEAGLTPCDASQATLSLVLPQDRALWPISKQRRLIEIRSAGEIARADAFQVLYDVSRSPGPDVDEALQAWRSGMLSGRVT